MVGTCHGHKSTQASNGKLHGDDCREVHAAWRPPPYYILHRHPQATNSLVTQYYTITIKSVRDLGEGEVLLLGKVYALQEVNMKLI